MFKRILVCLDDSPTSTHALQVALQVAGLHGSAVHFVHVLEHPISLGGYSFEGYGQHFMELARQHAGDMLRNAVAAAAAAGVTADSHLLDVPAQRLAEAAADEIRAWQADLVVVGSHGRKGVSRAVLGSGAEAVLRQSPVPVLVVRAPVAAVPAGAARAAQAGAPSTA